MDRIKTFPQSRCLETHQGLLGQDPTHQEVNHSSYVREYHVKCEPEMNFSHIQLSVSPHLK